MGIGLELLLYVYIFSQQGGFIEWVSNHCTEIISSTAPCAEVAYVLEEDHKTILQDINVL